MGVKRKKTNLSNLFEAMVIDFSKFLNPSLCRFKSMFYKIDYKMSAHSYIIYSMNHKCFIISFKIISLIMDFHRNLNCFTKLFFFNLDTQIRRNFFGS